MVDKPICMNGTYWLPIIIKESYFNSGDVGVCTDERFGDTVRIWSKPYSWLYKDYHAWEVQHGIKPVFPLKNELKAMKIRVDGREVYKLKLP